jgi:hypothetical protein
MSPVISLPPYSELTGSAKQSTRFIEISESAFMALLSSALQHVEVDEAWYLGTYQDVAEAFGRGEITSAKEHYTRAGYFEDRLPRDVQVDEEWYQATYPDVREAVEFGRLASGQQHFMENGFREGRLPYAGWSLFS